MARGGVGVCRACRTREGQRRDDRVPVPDRTLSERESGGGDAGLAALDGSAALARCNSGSTCCASWTSTRYSFVGGQALLALGPPPGFRDPRGRALLRRLLRYDLRALLNVALDEPGSRDRCCGRAQSACSTRRVEAVRADVTLYRAESRLRVAIAVRYAAGPFSSRSWSTGSRSLAADFFTQAA